MFKNVRNVFPPFIVIMSSFFIVRYLTFSPNVPGTLVMNKSLFSLSTRFFEIVISVFSRSLIFSLYLIFFSAFTISFFLSAVTDTGASGNNFFFLR